MIRFIVPRGDGSETDMTYWAGDTPVSRLKLLRDSQPLPALQATAQINGVDIKVLFDTGAMSMVSLAAAHRAGVPAADMAPAVVAHGMGSGEAKTWVATVAKFELAGEAIGSPRLKIADFDFFGTDMLLGIDFFLSHRIYVSKGQRRM